MALRSGVEKEFPDKMTSELPEAVADGDFTSREAYQTLGATMHVLSDDYKGLLKDADTEKALSEIGKIYFEKSL